MEQLDEDDPDVFLAGALDRYKTRPNKLENMCLCEFFTKYKTLFCKPKDNEARAEGTSDEEEEDNQALKRITLKDNLDQMIERKTAAIVRYH